MGLGFGGVWGRNPQLPKAIEGLGVSLLKARDSGNGALALGDFCNFVIKITYFYAYFGQNRYFKAITHQIKAFKIMPRYAHAGLTTRYRTNSLYKSIFVLSRSRDKWFMKIERLFKIAGMKFEF